MEKPELFIAINRESAIAKAQEWAKTNNQMIIDIHAYPEDFKNPYGWWLCEIKSIEKTENEILSIETENNINAV